MSALKISLFFVATVLTSVVSTLLLIAVYLDAPLSGKFHGIVKGGSFWAGSAKWPTAVLDGSDGGRLSLVSSHQKLADGSIEFEIRTLGENSYSPKGLFLDKSGSSIDFTFIHPNTPLKSNTDMSKVPRVPCIVLRNAESGVTRFICAE